MRDVKPRSGPEVLVLGADGMLGHKVFLTLLHQGFDVTGARRGTAGDALSLRVPFLAAERVLHGVDVRETSSFVALLRKLRPGAVVNCVGVVKQRPAAGDAVSSITVNSLLPHLLAETLSEWSGRLIHVSTDCVFSGRKGGYSDADEPDATDLYGRSKALGEVSGPNCLTLRTSIVGRELKEFRSLLEWFLSNAGGTARGYTASRWSGVSTNWLARTIACVLREKPGLSGLYHVSTAPLSKFDLLRMFNTAFAAGVTLAPVEGEAMDRSLESSRFFAETGLERPSWPGLAEELAADPTPYSNWR